ncbi:MAG: 50S ribosome-binding GTPase [Phycisphaerales bacterium]|nr:50S ribosome-binding GTPase [Phycisphaerales bacterium]
MDAGAEDIRTPSLDATLEALTGRSGWPPATVRRCDLAGIDEGVVAVVAPGGAMIMPHGGVRIVQRLLLRLSELGVRLVPAEEIAPEQLYPEAASSIEAEMLVTLARAASPLAIDLLLDQPRRWREAGPRPLTNEDRARSHRLDRLVRPPSVVVAGPANVGKSTLTNALAGRTVSIAADLAGTTRDYTTGTIDLNGLVVRWFDTPGLRDAADEIESRAIALAANLMRSCDLLIAMTDAEHDWPDLPRPPDLRVAGRCDLGARADADAVVSAKTGEGIEAFVRIVRERLVPAADLAHEGRWGFWDRGRAFAP